VQQATFTLVEESAGTGQLEKKDGNVLGVVRYSISRYQGMLVGSGMPIPGLHRLEGSTDFKADTSLIGRPLVLRLEDGRALAITLAATDGRILAEGHGPCGGCSCC